MKKNLLIVALVVAIVPVFVAQAVARYHHQRNSYRGTITSIDTTSTPNSISITEYNGTTVSISVDSTTIYRVGCQTGQLGYLQAGVHIEAHVSPSTGIATVIEARPEDVFANYHGTITAIDTTTTPTQVTITRHSGATVTFSADSTTLVYINHQADSLTDLATGMHARAEVVKVTNLATKICAESTP